jgi:hypothetical protein
MGVSIKEWIYRKEWNIPIGGVKRDFGNCQLNWLAGPHNDRHKDSSAYNDYYNRILDYWIAAGFGNKAEFDLLISKEFSNEIIGVYTRTNNRIDDRDTSFGIDKITL